ncbi:MAG: DUF4290 domain-containing protein [Opitutaceae bacterium]|nr:DUF4290 domain-containing protein [Cytophagales bacterium]
MHTYNTSQSDIILKEYGRVVQNMVHDLKKIEDREKRNQNAKAIIELMKQLHSQMKDPNMDYSQKLWDDLCCMANFDLDVDSPYPKAEASTFNAKPRKVEYSQKEMRYKHYGRNVELLMDEAKKITDPEEKENAIIYIGKLMKALYGAWNKEVIEEEVILEHMRRMSGGELFIDINRVKNENLFQTGMRLRKQSGNSMIKDNTAREGATGGSMNRGRSNNNNNRNNNNRNNNNRNNNNNNRNKK